MCMSWWTHHRRIQKGATFKNEQNYRKPTRFWDCSMGIDIWVPWYAFYTQKLGELSRKVYQFLQRKNSIHHSNGQKSWMDVSESRASTVRKFIRIVPRVYDCWMFGLSRSLWLEVGCIDWKKLRPYFLWKSCLVRWTRGSFNVLMPVMYGECPDASTTNNLLLKKGGDVKKAKNLPGGKKDHQ